LQPITAITLVHKAIRRMASKIQFLAVATLTCFALAAIPDTSKDLAAGIAEAFSEALKEEQPMLKEEEASHTLADFAGLHKAVVQAHKQVSTDDLAAALSNPGGWATEFEKDVTDLVIGLSKGGFGATPFGDSVKKISDIIQKDMMPQVIHFHTKDQDKLITLNEEWKSCAITKDKELNLANTLKLKYQTSSKSHKSCRGAEAALYTENVECHAEWVARKKEKELKCKAYAEVSKKYGDSNANKQIMTKGGSEGVETYVRRFTSVICGKDIKCLTCKNGQDAGAVSGGRSGMLDDLIKHKKRCELATKRYNEQTKKCKDLDQKWHDKRKECNSIQDTMDGASCKWAIDSKDACESYAECWTVKKAAYEEAVCSKWENDDKAKKLHSWC